MELAGGNAPRVADCERRYALADHRIDTDVGRVPLKRARGRSSGPTRARVARLWRCFASGQTRDEVVGHCSPCGGGDLALEGGRGGSA